MTSFEATAVTTSASANTNGQPVVRSRPFSDPSRLAPEAAFGAQPPLRRPVENELFSRSINGVSDAEIINTTSAVTSVRRRHDKERGRSGSRRGKGVWKKLLWVKQPKYPDNYTDPPTFLSHLQRNPRFRPYDFWPLVADFTVIVQHLCSVSIFVCCFVGIYQDRISPVSVVGWGSAGTVLGWVLWDSWVSQAEAAKTTARRTQLADVDGNITDSFSTSGPASMSTGSSRPTSFGGKESHGLGIALTASNLSNHRDHSYSHSRMSTPSASTAPSPILSHQSSLPNFASHSVDLSPTSSNYLLSPQNQQRLATVKSAILIYCALLGLSPILKSLTMSTSSDSIWALSCWLMCINIFFFDYGGGVGVKSV
ncbi:MAG: hypothetical protein Q9167_006620 [Letrouitia subvulpina]